jgi:hypothetical protein
MNQADWVNLLPPSAMKRFAFVLSTLFALTLSVSTPLASAPAPEPVVQEEAGCRLICDSGVCFWACND